MTRTRLLISLSALVTGIGLSAACGDDDEIPTVDADAGAEAGADTGSPDTSLPDLPDSGSPDTTVADAIGDGPRTLDGALCDGAALAVATIDPFFGSSLAPTPLTITGSGFVQTPTVFLRSGATLIPLEHVAYVDSTSLSADVPASVAVGSYEVIVQNPTGCVDISAGTFKMVANAPPRVLTVTPATGTTQTDVPVTITGCHFPTATGGSTLSTVDLNGVIAPQVVTTVTCAGDGGATCSDGSPLCTMTGTIQTDTGAGLAEGAYLVRVGNAADATWGDYSVFTVTNPNGKLVGNWTAAPSLNQGRRSHGAIANRIDDARRFVYAVGGENAAGVPLASVEVAPLDRYGRLGKWFVARSPLNQARSGLSLVRQGRYLYAIGGTAATGGTGGATPGAPLDTIERAVVLNPADAPKLAQATVTLGTGSLAAATYYYQVSAIKGAGDVDDPNGESLPSDEVVATMSAAGQVTLTWTKVSGAVGYLVYRSPTSTSASHSETLLATLGDVSTYVDGQVPGDGGADAGAPSTRTPLAIGSTGAWTVIAQTLSSARVNATAVVATDPVGAHQLYVLGGWGDCPGLPAGNALMNCYEKATIAANGGALTSVFVPGATNMAHARMRHGGDVLTAANGPSKYTADGGANTSAFVMVGGGFGPSSSGASIEYALITTGGLLGTFGSTTGFSQERDGTQLAIVNGYAYALFGGKAPNPYKATSDLSTEIVVTPTTVVLGNWSNAGANAAQPLARFGLASDSAYFYAVGGTTNDTDALATVNQIIR